VVSVIVSVIIIIVARVIWVGWFHASSLELFMHAVKGVSPFEVYALVIND
jgi:hypothetical protein